MYAQVVENLKNSNAFQPSLTTDAEAIKAFMARITGQAEPLNDAEKVEMKNALDIIATELKTKLTEVQMQVRSKPLSGFNEGMDFFAMNTGVVEFPIKLMQRGKEITDVTGLQAKLEEHGILIIELHFVTGEKYEFVMRHRKGDTHFQSYVYKI